MRFLRLHVSRLLEPVRFQHQAYDHVPTPEERQKAALTLTCTDYVLLNPLRAGLVKRPQEWRYKGALVPGYPRVDPFEPGYWEWFWRRYDALREPGLESRILPPREME